MPSLVKTCMKYIYIYMLCLVPGKIEGKYEEKK